MVKNKKQPPNYKDVIFERGEYPMAQTPAPDGSGEPAPMEDLSGGTPIPPPAPPAPAPSFDPMEQMRDSVPAPRSIDQDIEGELIKLRADSKPNKFGDVTSDLTRNVLMPIAAVMEATMTKGQSPGTTALSVMKNMKNMEQRRLDNEERVSQLRTQALDRVLKGKQAAGAQQELDTAEKSKKMYDELISKWDTLDEQTKMGLIGKMYPKEYMSENFAYGKYQGQRDDKLTAEQRAEQRRIETEQRAEQRQIEREQRAEGSAQAKIDAKTKAEAEKTQKALSTSLVPYLKVVKDYILPNETTGGAAGYVFQAPGRLIDKITGGANPYNYLAAQNDAILPTIAKKIAGQTGVLAEQEQVRAKNWLIKPSDPKPIKQLKYDMLSSFLDDKTTADDVDAQLAKAFGAPEGETPAAPAAPGGGKKTIKLKSGKVIEVE